QLLVGPQDVSIGMLEASHFGSVVVDVAGKLRPLRLDLALRPNLMGGVGNRDDHELAVFPLGNRFERIAGKAQEAVVPRLLDYAHRFVAGRAFWLLARRL